MHTSLPGARCMRLRLRRQLALLLVLPMIMLLTNIGSAQIYAAPSNRALAAAALSRATAIAAGLDHTCALTSDGGVKCWGDNVKGQLGDGTTTARSTPVDVVELGYGVAAITASYWHTCALTVEGGVKCWGGNNDGQLGDGTTTDRYTPVDVVGLTSGVTAIAAGYWHTCALTVEGGVKCWGNNYVGQLGDGTTTSSLTPVDVSGLSKGIVDLAASSEHTCGLTVGGGIKCWGWNEVGELGDGTAATRLTPMDVIGLPGWVTAITAGGISTYDPINENIVINTSHTCAVSNGAATCWGGNIYGQLGNDSTADSFIPVDVGGLTSGVKAVAAGDGHTCALMTTGGVKCWGWNNNGVLGDGSSTDRLTPVDVSGLTSGAEAITTGFAHTCALMTDGGVKCWGVNNLGQLGDGSTSERDTPVDVVGFGFSNPAWRGLYVAMGDSIASGEGTFDYDINTDVPLNRCHRSPTYSYAAVLASKNNTPTLPVIVACSGAQTENIWDTTQDGELPQLQQLTHVNGPDDKVALVTVTIGANDAGFADVLKTCALALYHGCTKQDREVTNNILKLCLQSIDNPRLGCGPQGNLPRLYQEIRRLAPKARILVIGYPFLFNQGDGKGCTLQSGIRPYLSPTDIGFIYDKGTLLNQIIATSTQISGLGIEYVDISQALVGHEVCTNDPWVNDLTFDKDFAFGLGHESFHPNREGYKHIAAVIDQYLKNNPLSQHISISPYQNVSDTIRITPGQAQATFSTTWPGSDVVLRLTSPSGREIDRSVQDGDIVHTVGPTYESYTVADPEPGVWIVNIFGADVNPDGEEVVLQMTQTPPIHEPPTAALKQSAATGNAPLTVSFDGTDSTSSTGEIVDYTWDFGDGTSESGVSTSHVYIQPGIYTPILTVTDDTGARGYISGAPIILPGVFLPVLQH